MTRAAIDYSARRSATASEGFSVEDPAPGFYRMRLRRGAHWVGVRIWHGPPHDPDTGEVMDRSPRWQAEINGEYVELERVWPRCGRDPVDEAEYHHLIALRDWGREHDPDGPQANPHRPVDLLTSAIPF